MESEPELNHLKLVKEEPKLAVEYLDRYKMLAETFYNTHRVLTQELDTVLEDFTDPPKAIELRRRLDGEVRHDQSKTRGKKPMVGEIDIPQTRSPSYDPYLEQYYNDARAKYEEEQAAWEASDLDELKGNSEGWEVEPYAGTKDDPIPCYASDEGESSQAKVKPYGPPGGRTNPINLDEYNEGSYINPYAKVKMENSSEMWTYPYVRDTYEYGQYDTTRNYTSYNSYYPSTSDPEYIPSGHPYIPDVVRRTPRKHGWTSGMYYEDKAE
jgi:hypothetical protein